MEEKILALCRAMGAGREELLLPLVRAVSEQLAGRLRPGLASEECGPAFPLAAAMIAVDRLAGMTGGGEIASFTAGDVTVRRGAGKSLSRQAEELLALWLEDGGFVFQGVEG